MNSILDILPHRYLPRKPYCSDVSKAMTTRPLLKALAWPYIQLNWPGLRRVITADIDRRVGPFGWDECLAPPPNFTVHSSKTGRAHYSYVLDVPVNTRPLPSGRLRHPAWWLGAIERALIDRLEADRIISHITHNPYAPGPDRIMTVHRVELYTLDELDSWVGSLPPERRRRTTNDDSAVGRNVSLFDDLRFWAYPRVAHAREAGGDWFSSVLEQAEEINREFSVPLAFAEVRWIAKSVAKWTWRRYQGYGPSYNAGAARRAGFLDGAETPDQCMAAGARFAHSEISRKAAEVRVSSREKVRELYEVLLSDPGLSVVERARLQAKARF